MSPTSQIVPGPTVLFQPPNHVGLGHLSRLSAIALALREIDNSIRTPFVVEGAAHILLDTLGLPHLPLPSSHVLYETGHWDSWTKNERSSLETEASRAMLGCLKPQVVVFDCFPNLPFLSATIAAHLPVALCLREMRNLDRYLNQGRDLLQHVQLLLIPHDAGTFELPPDLSEKACFVGRVARPVGPCKRMQRNPDQPRIVIAGGGGGYPGTVNFYNLATEAVLVLRSQFPGLKGHLIAGPLFGDWSRLQHNSAVTVVPFEPDTLGMFATADLVIAQAGYNTVAELAEVGAKAILVPAQRQWDDQFARADRTARACWKFRTFRGSGYADLAQLVAEFLQTPALPIQPTKADGAHRAAASICTFLGKLLN